MYIQQSNPDKSAGPQGFAVISRENLKRRGMITELKVTELKYELIKMHDNELIQIARFEPEGPPKGVVQAVHGFGEHIDRYREMADFFTRNEYIFVIHDQRGFGMMPGKTKKQREAMQGIVPDFRLLLDDVETIRKRISLWYPDLPVILYGHSMGGNIAINCLLKQTQSRYQKLIAESPWLRLYTPLFASTLACARLAAKISPKFAIVKKLDPNRIARTDPAAERPAKDEYYHNRISLRLFTQAADAGEYAIKNAYGISVPTLLMCAEHDKIVCSDAIREFFRNSDKNVAIEEYPGACHSLHTDIIKNDALNRMLEFCNE